MLTDQRGYVYWFYVYHLTRHITYNRREECIWFSWPANTSNTAWLKFGQSLPFERFIHKYCIV